MTKFSWSFSDVIFLHFSPAEERIKAAYDDGVAFEKQLQNA